MRHASGQKDRQTYRPRLSQYFERLPGGGRSNNIALCTAEGCQSVGGNAQRSVMKERRERSRPRIAELSFHKLDTFPAALDTRPREAVNITTCRHNKRCKNVSKMTPVTVSTGRVTKSIVVQSFFANSAREQGCSVHITRAHGPSTRVVNTARLVWIGACGHGCTK